MRLSQLMPALFETQDSWWKMSLPNRIESAESQRASFSESWNSPL